MSLQRVKSRDIFIKYVTPISSYAYTQSNNNAVDDNPSQFYIWRDSANNLCLFPCGLSGNAERSKDSRLTNQLALLEEADFIKVLKITKIPISKISRFVEGGSQYKTSHEVETISSKVDRQVASMSNPYHKKGGNSAAKGAFIGGVVGGVPGAVVGSVIGATSQANRNANTPQKNIPAPRYNTFSRTNDNRLVSLFVKDDKGNEIIFKFKSAYMPGTAYGSNDDTSDEIQYKEAREFEEIFNNLIPEKHARNN